MLLSKSRTICHMRPVMRRQAGISRAEQAPTPRPPQTVLQPKLADPANAFLASCGRRARLCAGVAKRLRKLLCVANQRAAVGGAMQQHDARQPSAPLHALPLCRPLSLEAAPAAGAQLQPVPFADRSLWPRI